MNDQTTTIADIRKHIQEFSNARGWRKEDNAKDLVMALTVEAAELAEIFTWLHSDQVDDIRDNAEVFEHMKDEISDVFWYVCRLCEHFGVDLAEAVDQKTLKNAIKYPV